MREDRGLAVGSESHNTRGRAVGGVRGARKEAQSGARFELFDDGVEPARLHLGGVIVHLEASELKVELVPSRRRTSRWLKAAPGECFGARGWRESVRYAFSAGVGAVWRSHNLVALSASNRRDFRRAPRGERRWLAPNCVPPRISAPKGKLYSAHMMTDDVENGKSIFHKKLRLVVTGSDFVSSRGR